MYKASSPAPYGIMLHQEPRASLLWGQIRSEERERGGEGDGLMGGWLAELELCLMKQQIPPGLSWDKYTFLTATIEGPNEIVSSSFFFCESTVKSTMSAVMCYESVPPCRFDCKRSITCCGTAGPPSSAQAGQAITCSCWNDAIRFFLDY